MATDNKVIFERTNVLAANVTVGTSYGYLDEGDFGWYGKAGETYVFDANVFYEATAATDGAAFSIKTGTTPTSLSFVSTYPTDATTVVTTIGVAVDTPDHGTASIASSTGLNVATVKGVITPAADGFIGISGIAENAPTIVARGGLTNLTWKRVDWPAEA